ncbi:hypothetical protein BO99DRAFT_477529 [Aspergillus violaceofuscus CBS 115571]|uniref:Uncharacterized protein n=1 Tax=Aspergillus violaceofuscus (strain CBS 115571) TaxID=1450538 RepID=A0A2V5HCU5_ASPV1|nr:hypothetical protein BO99DRAFT_477529 [Aspergillus violaceofuscus CBS 115571]
MPISDHSSPSSRASSAHSIHSTHSIHSQAQYESLELVSWAPSSAEHNPQPHQSHDGNKIDLVTEGEIMIPPDEANGPEKKRSTWTVMQEWYVLELASMLVAAGCVVATVIVLRRYDRRPQPAWRYMSLNALISWLSTISKACILFAVSEALGQLKWVWFAQGRRRPLPNLQTFDSASRGLYGSAQLIWMLRGRHFAIWGSLAVILALAYDPSVQNLIHYYSDLMEDAHQQAWVANTSTYASYGSGMLGSDPWVDPVLKGNVYNALFNLDDTRPWATPHYVCSSGNCTWNPVAALGARALCSDVTQHLETKNASVETGGGLKNTVFLPNSTVTVWFNASYVGDQVYMAMGTVDPRLARVYTNATYPPIQFIAPRGYNSSSGDRYPRLTSMSQFQATECSLEPTVYSFNASVQSNVYREEILAAWSRDMRAQSTKRGVMPPFKGSPPGWGTAEGIMQPNQTFLITDTASSGLGTFLQYLFAGSYRVTGSKTRLQVDQGTAYATADTIQALMSGNMTGCSMQTAEKFACAMHNVAAAVTKSFRDAAYIAVDSDVAAANMTAGHGWVNQTYVQVHWQWATLPVVVWVLGLLTLLGAWWKARRSEVPSWRNSPMPLLFLYREDKWEGESTVEEPFPRREDVRVMLCKDNGRFVLA